MPTARESLCCQEVGEVIQKANEYGDSITCIVQHPGFQSVCLDVWVLQTAGSQHRQEYGISSINGDVHELVYLCNAMDICYTYTNV